MGKMKIKWPQWYMRRSKKEDEENQVYTDEEDVLLKHAWLGLEDGNLKPLANLLKSEYAGLHSRISLALLSMIEGEDGINSNYRLTVTKHPKLKRKPRSHRTILENINRKNKIRAFIAQNNGHLHGQNEAAVSLAINKFDLSRRTILKIWGEYIAITKYDIRRNEWLNKVIPEAGGYDHFIKVVEIGEVSEFPPDDFHPDVTREELIKAINKRLKL